MLSIIMFISVLIIMSIISFVMGIKFTQNIQEIKDNRPFRGLQGDYQYRG